jgi:hypothetical protein
MGKGIREPGASHESERTALGELIHQHVPLAIETAIHEELRAALGARSYERSEVRRGYRNGTKTRTLTGPSGPVALTVPRATLFGATEWTSKILPRYQRRLRAVNEAIVATYLAGGQHPPDSQCAPTPAQGRAPVEERGLARRRHAEDGLSGLADALAGRRGCRVPLPRRLRAARPQRRKGGERPGSRRGRGAVRREQTPADLGAVRRRVGGSVERVSRRSGGAQPARSGALHH